jgi:hypothetical protein
MLKKIIEIMRNILNNINIIGATMIFREGEHCKQTIDWLCNFCNKVILLLDNYDNTTEKIALEYKEKFKDKINLIYSNEPIIQRKNLIQGQIKKRFKNRQQYIREQVIRELHRINKEEKKVDIFIFIDSDEIPINQFESILEDFWNNHAERYLMAGYINPIENFNAIMTSSMAPHARIFKYCEEMSAIPYVSRTRFNPYCKERGWKVRNLMLHLCNFNEQRRKFRQFCDNTPWLEESQNNPVWILPKDCREMTIDEISLYQPGQHQRPSFYSPITLREYLKINNK